MTRHLWDFDHPYYCELPGDRNHDQQLVEFGSWGEFAESDWADSDPDARLLFRWDWKPPHPRLEETEHTVDLFFVRQRGGCLWQVSITVTMADETAVRDWLAPRARHLRAVWSPLLDDNVDADRRAAVGEHEQALDRAAPLPDAFTAAGHHFDDMVIAFDDGVRRWVTVITIPAVPAAPVGTTNPYASLYRTAYAHVPEPIILLTDDPAATALTAAAHTNQVLPAPVTIKSRLITHAMPLPGLATASR